MLCLFGLTVVILTSTLPIMLNIIRLLFKWFPKYDVLSDRMAYRLFGVSYPFAFVAVFEVEIHVDVAGSAGLFAVGIRRRIRKAHECMGCYRAHRVALNVVFEIFNALWPDGILKEKYRLSRWKVRGGLQVIRTCIEKTILINVEQSFNPFICAVGTPAAHGRRRVSDSNSVLLYEAGRKRCPVRLHGVLNQLEAVGAGVAIVFGQIGHPSRYVVNKLTMIGGP